MGLLVSARRDAHHLAGQGAKLGGTPEVGEFVAARLLLFGVGAAAADIFAGEGEGRRGGEE